MSKISIFVYRQIYLVCAERGECNYSYNGKNTAAEQGDQMGEGMGKQETYIKFKHELEENSPLQRL